MISIFVNIQNRTMKIFPQFFMCVAKFMHWQRKSNHLHVYSGMIKLVEWSTNIHGRGLTGI